VLEFVETLRAVCDSDQSERLARDPSTSLRAGSQPYRGNSIVALVTTLQITDLGQFDKSD